MYHMEHGAPVFLAPLVLPVLSKLILLGRVYAVIPPNGDTTGAVVECTFFVTFIPIRILFDLEATHLFIDVSFMNKLGLVPVLLFPPMSVSTPIRRSAELDWVCKSFSMKFDGEESEFLANLIVLPMRDFDVLLGMDWLASYHAVIDCFYKMVL